MPALVSALKRVDLPTLGSPTMPHFIVCSSLLAEQRLDETLALLGFLGLLGFLDRGYRLLGLLLGRLFLLRLLLRRRRTVLRMQLLHRALHVPRDHLRQQREG